MTIITNAADKGYNEPKFCGRFIKRFRIKYLLRIANATKEKGVSSYELFSFLIGMIFSGKNLYTTLEICHEKTGFAKDTVYRFLNRASINWERFIMQLSCLAISNVSKLTSDDRKNALIVDDSPYYRNRSKRVEMLSRCYDHVEKKFYKGLTLLTLGWSDGKTFIPVTSRLLGSGSEKNLLEGSRVKTDNRTLATKRRADARKEKPALVMEMLKAAKGTAAAAKYVLFDSWFASPSSLLSIAGIGFHVVARLKNNRNFRYSYGMDTLSISEIYKANKKRRGKSRYLLSVEIGVRHKDYAEQIPARIVYVRDKGNRKNWIALISTDMSLTEEDVIALYGKRWNIETFHKMIKSFLGLAKEFQTRSYDAMTAHTAVVMTRYILLSVETRENIDDRSFGELFYECCKEIEDITFVYALNLIVCALISWLNEHLLLSKPVAEALLDEFIAELPLHIKDKLPIVMCES